MAFLDLRLLLTFCFYLVIATLALFPRAHAPTSLSGVQQKHPGTSTGAFLTCLIPLYFLALSTVPGAKMVLSHGC